MHTRYEKDGLIIIGVNVDQEREDALAFLETYPSRFNIHYDPSDDLAATEAPRRRRQWKVAIEGDRDGEPERVIDLKRGALATSGDTRRFLCKDGVRYSHILDPTTGWPVPDAPRSITIVASTCVEAGTVSTLAMLKGSGAEGFLEEQAVASWCRR